MSCKTEYALLALMELASHYSRGEPLQIRQIATQQGIPDRYLEQILAALRRGGLVLSQRGAKGGYILAREPWKINLLDAIACLESLNSRNKLETLCQTVEGEVLTQVWQEIRDRTLTVLQHYTLQDLCERRDARAQAAIMYYI
nr:Rrf2 family transcriptional regulator [Oscillatoria sp. FACHB-1406]